MANLALNTASDHSASPFDRIRRFDECGIEYWMARELMKLLGYKVWHKFDQLVQRVVKSIEIQEQDPSVHICRTENMVLIGSGVGRVVEDFRLTRYACYLVAMSGDNSKTEIAMAQRYFAIKTREAEAVIPAQNERLRELELELAILRERSSIQTRQDNRLAILGWEKTLILEGKADTIQHVEVKTTEVLNAATGEMTPSFLSAEQLKRAVADRTGQKLRSQAHFVEALRKAGRDDLLLPVTRSQTSEYVQPDRLDEAIAVVYGTARQRLIGE